MKNFSAHSALRAGTFGIRLAGKFGIRWRLNFTKAVFFFSEGTDDIQH